MTLAKGTPVRIQSTHGHAPYRGRYGIVDTYVPFGKYYVVLKRNSDLEAEQRILVDETHLQNISDREYLSEKGFKMDDDLDGIIRVHGLTFEEWVEDAGVDPEILKDVSKRRRLLSMWLRAEDPAEFSFEEEAAVVPAWIKRR